MFDDPHGRAFLLPVIVIKMSNITTPVIDLPNMVEHATDAVELSAVRLTACLRGIERLRALISDKCLLDDEMQEVFNAASEMELMIEKARSVIDEFYEPSVSALVYTKRFLDAQFPNS
ncbi:hypothetical protein [Sphingobacterium multivorum]|uniref:hypothetical protein n=2 Tax=Sphingobacterium multivorum TaxID=28454 RepID=UPI000E0FCBA6|nr:hypothetical protein [Sphingobacterium multivorum]QQT43346.1 hypothetical protein I6J00_16500 [Sphingobacterium multivorum]